MGSEAAARATGAALSGDEAESAAEVLSLGAGVAAPDADDLVACLEFLTRFYQRPQSAAVLKAGLPLTGARLTPTRFIRAAARAGLVARVLRKPLRSLAPGDLPLVAILDGDHACVIVERAKQGDGYVALFPEDGGGVRDVSAEELAQHYAGHLLVA